MRRLAGARRSQKSSHPSQVTLAIADMEVSEAGVAQFLWPLPNADLLRMREAAARALVHGLREHKASSPHQVDIATILLVQFLREALACFAAHALVRRYRTRGVDVVVPAESAMLRAALEERVPTRSQTLEMLRAGLQRARWKAPIRWLRNLTLRDGLWRIPWLLVRPERDIVATSVYPFVIEHARAVKDRVVVQWLHDQMGPPGTAERVSAEALGAPVQDVCMLAVKRGFEVAGERLPAHFDTYLRSWLDEASGLVDVYYRRILHHPNRIPRRLWTGTGGIIWSRILRQVVRRVGGHVTGHDHASGVGQWRTHNRNLIEFETCDAFVTFNQGQREGLIRTRDPALLVQDFVPEIETFPRKPARGAGRSASASGPRSYSGRGRSGARRLRVMYVATIYLGDSVHLNPLVPDLVAVDWQARLLARLRGRGYEVFHKPHPESALAPPAAFERVLGIRCIEGRFEDVLECFDVALFDVAKSTAFGAALRAGKPVVWVDLALDELQPEARTLLGRRCSIVRAEYDEIGRVHVDWEELFAGLERAGELVNDDRFVVRYLAV